MNLAHWFGIVFVLAGLIALVGAILISGNISRPLIDISRMAQRVESGDLRARVEVRTKDEVGLRHQHSSVKGAIHERITDQSCSPRRRKLRAEGCHLCHKSLRSHLV